MISVIDCGIGNIGSIINMLKHIGHKAKRVHTPAELEDAANIILPGVGAFDAGMHNLEQSNMLPLLHEKAQTGVPILGICLGMQLLFERSEEGTMPGLGWIPGEVKRFRKDNHLDLKIPHIGWCKVNIKGEERLFTNLQENRFYFVHSYHAVCDNKHIIGTAEHGYKFAAAVRNNSVMGVQFHPEKSHRFGMQLLRNFVETIGG
jgi:glutamine amidotransferase